MMRFPLGSRVQDLNTLDGLPGRLGTVRTYVPDTASYCGDPECVCGWPEDEYEVQWDDGEVEVALESWIREAP